MRKGFALKPEDSPADEADEAAADLALYFLTEAYAAEVRRQRGAHATHETLASLRAIEALAAQRSLKNYWRGGDYAHAANVAAAIAS